MKFYKLRTVNNIVILRISFIAQVFFMYFNKEAY